MPGMPIFQDSPSQLKGQIYVLNSTTSAVEPLQVDNTGNLNVAGTVALAAGTEVTLAAGADIDNVASVTTVSTLDTVTNDVKIVNGSTDLTVGLAAGTEVTLAAGADIDNVASVTTVTTLDTVTNDVKIVNGTNPLNVGLSTGTNVIGKVENQLVFTNVDAFGDPTPLTGKTVGATATVTADSQDVSLETSYNWFIKNTGTTSSDQDITLVVELSPDGVNWIEDTGSIITVPFNTSKMITVTNFLQNARYTITGGVAETTVISCFQAQH